MSHGDRVESLAEGFLGVAASEGAPFAIATDEERRRYSLMFHPEVVTPPTAASCWPTSPGTSAAARASGAWPLIATRRSPTSAPRSARPGHLRPVGGVDSAVAAVLIHEGDRRAADLRVRRPRPDAFAGSRPGRAPCSVGLQHSAGPRSRRGAVPVGPRRPHRSEAKRKFIGKTFIEVFEAEARRSAVPTSWRRARSILT
jgi:GMP synthase (glutamine-hydrolysing)